MEFQWYPIFDSSELCYESSDQIQEFYAAFSAIGFAIIPLMRKLWPKPYAGKRVMRLYNSLILQAIVSFIFHAYNSYWTQFACMSAIAITLWNYKDCVQFEITQPWELVWNMTYLIAFWNPIPFYAVIAIFFAKFELHLIELKPKKNVGKYKLLCTLAIACQVIGFTFLALDINLACEYCHACWHVAMAIVSIFACIIVENLYADGELKL